MTTPRLWNCSTCGKRLWIAGDYERHIDNGDHERRLRAKHQREADKVQAARDAAAGAMDLGAWEK